MSPMTPTGRIPKLYDYEAYKWVEFDRRIDTLTADEAKRFVPHSRAAQAMLADLVRQGTSPGQAVLIVLTLMPHD